MGVMPSYDMFKRQMLTLLEAKRLANAWDQNGVYKWRATREAAYREQFREENKEGMRAEYKTDKQYTEKKDVFFS